MCEDCGCGHTEPSGEIMHYYGKPMVAVVRLGERIKNGDTIRVQGSTTDFIMTIRGMRNETEQEVDEAQVGEVVAFRTPEVARQGDKIWLVMREVSG